MIVGPVGDKRTRQCVEADRAIAWRRFLHVVWVGVQLAVLVIGLLIWALVK